MLSWRLIDRLMPHETYICTNEMNDLAKSFAATIAAMTLLGTSWAADPVLINVDTGNPPYMFKKDGKATGVYPALIAAAFSRIGVPVNIEARPWIRAIYETEEGKSGIGGFYKNEERLKQYDFSEPILTENVAVYFNKSKPVNFRTIADLNGKRIGVIRGWSYGEAFDAARKEHRFVVEEFPSDWINLVRLNHGLLDVALAVEESGKLEMAAGKLVCIEQSPTYLVSSKTHLAFAKSARKTGLLADFDTAIVAMKSDGTFEQMTSSERSRHAREQKRTLRLLPAPPCPRANMPTQP